MVGRAVCLACENISNATHRHQNLFELQSGGGGRITLTKCEPLKWIFPWKRTLLKTMWLFVTKTEIFCHIVYFYSAKTSFCLFFWNVFFVRLNLWSLLRNFSLLPFNKIQEYPNAYNFERFSRPSIYEFYWTAFTSHFHLFHFSTGIFRLSHHFLSLCFPGPKKLAHLMTFCGANRWTARVNFHAGVRRIIISLWHAQICAGDF